MIMASGNDMKEHSSTYTGFIGLVKWGTILSAVVAALAVYAIA
jgi:Bacterial aa3 type cytochrome c oxidase subunit IV